MVTAPSSASPAPAPERAPAAGGPSLVGEHGRWATIVSALDRPTCEAIVELCRSLDVSVPGTVGPDVLPGHRVGRVHRVERVPATERVYELVWELGSLVNDREFHLDLSGIAKPPEYVEYDAGLGHFHWHNDYGLERPVSRRKLTLSIQLSDPSEYDGGDLEVFATPAPLPRAQGSVTALPSYVHHRITPVTRGTRRALVAWLAGPPLR